MVVKALIYLLTSRFVKLIEVKLLFAFQQRDAL